MARHSSRIELSQSALRNNLAFVRERVGPHPTISLVVKANAYGHGIQEIVPMARRAGVTHFAAASGHEAQEAIDAGLDGARVMVMGILTNADLPWAIENDVEFFVFELSRLEYAAEIARDVGRPARIHLEVETGGNRTGLPEAELPKAARIIRKHADRFHLVGICTHLAGAESLATRFRIDRQLSAFQRVRAFAAKRRLQPEFFHVASSAAALALPERTAFDLVRVGVSAYGLWPSPDVYNLHLKRTGKSRDNPLSRVLSWKTEILHVKSIEKDSFVGYGTSYQAARHMRIAVLPLGYANGYPREMSNKGHVLVRGHKAPIVGLVNMNLFMVDVTKIPGVSTGDVVVLVGRQRNNVISIASFSEFSSALNTEFLCRLPAAIPRSAVR
ncbi:MAG: alanine racemase [Planctomycetota bacterium]